MLPEAKRLGASSLTIIGAGPLLGLASFLAVAAEFNEKFAANTSLRQAAKAAPAI